MRGSRAGAHEDAVFLGLSGNAMKLLPAGERQPADPHLRHVPGTHSEVVRMLNLPSERGRGAVMQVATANAHMYGLRLLSS